MSEKAPGDEVRSKPIAGTIGLAFGGLWSFSGASGLPHPLELPFEVLGSLVTLALIAALWLRRSLPGAGRGFFRQRAYIVAVILEVIAICAVSSLLPRFGLKSYLIEAVGALVGLHFTGLWLATRRPVFLWISGSMCGVSCLAAFLPSTWGEFSPRTMLTGFGCALVLWIGASRP